MKDQREDRKSTIFEEKEVCKRKIVEMVEQIEDLGMLQYLHRFIELFLEKWG